MNFGRHPQSRRTRRLRTSRGVLLFEVILALAVFSVVVIAMAECLQRTLEGIRLSQMEIYVQTQLTNRIALSRLQQPLELGHLEERTDDRGVKYTRDVEALTFETKARKPVTGLVVMRWTASWSGPAGPQTKTFQIYVPRS